MSLLNHLPISTDKKLEMKYKYLLDQLKSTNEDSTNKYKQMSLSPLRYTGGKTRGIGHMLEHFPKPIPRKIMSPFFGGGSFEIAVNTHLGIPIIGYDIFELLVMYWQYQILKPNALYHELKKLNPDEDTYTRVRMILMNYWRNAHPEWEYDNRDKYELTDTQKTLLDDDKLKRTAYYYYNHQLSYGPMFLGWKSSVYLNTPHYERILTQVKTFRVPKLMVKHGSFEKTIPKHKHDFIVADPPYYLEGDSKMFKAVYPNSNFPIHHEGFDHKLFRDILHEHKGGFLLTYGDCKTIREWYSDYDHYFPSWQYSMGQGETRIGKNRDETEEKSHVKKSHEIIIVKHPA